MKIEYFQKDTWLGKKTVITIHDFEGEKKELQKILDSIKEVRDND